MNGTIRSMLNAYHGISGPNSSVLPATNENAKKPSSIRFIVNGAPNNSTVSILSSLESVSASALFALPSDLSELSGDALREIAVARHQFAFSVSAENPADLEALTLANRQLFEATGMTTRLLYIEPDASILTAEQRDAFVAAGYRLWDATHHISASASVSKTITDLTKKFSESTAAVILSFPHTDSSAKIIAGVGNYMQTNSVSAQRINILSSPINHANDRR
jgi:hypothetical protein